MKKELLSKIANEINNLNNYNAVVQSYCYDWILEVRQTIQSKTNFYISTNLLSILSKYNVSASVQNSGGGNNYFRLTIYLINN